MPEGDWGLLDGKGVPEEVAVGVGTPSVFLEEPDADKLRGPFLSTDGSRDVET